MKKLLSLLFTFISWPVLAAEAAKLDTGNTAWVLISTVLVLTMTIPGLAIFYGGMVRKKNVLSVLMQTITATALLSVLWMAFGYSIAFSEGNPLFGGLDKAFLNGIGINELNGTIPEMLFVFFQSTFAIITGALLVGAFTDRIKFSASLWFLGLWVIFVYAPIAHMAWGPGGLFAGMGLLDFAGGTAVEINSGISGLVAAIMVGKRKGYGSENLAPHNLVLTVMGASLLWIGWLGFNAGSALTADGRAGMAVATTHMAGSMGLLAWTFLEWKLRGKPSVLGAATGAVAGLVAITPAAGFVDVKGGMIIGALAALLSYWGVMVLKARLKYDDSLDVFGVHGLCGILGTILTGVFAVEAIGGTAGLLEGNFAIVGVQIIATLGTIVYSGVVSFILLKAVELTIGLRVSPEEEREGLDLALHGETVP